MSNEKYCVIYALVDPRTEEVRYIGKTYKGIKNRKNQHVAHAKYGHVGHKHAWIRILIELGLEPLVVALEENVLVDNAKEREQYWVSYAKSNGWPLTNMTSGGEGAPRVSKDTAKNISIALKGRPFSDSHKAALKAARAKYPPMSQETKDKIAAANRGKPMHPNVKKVFPKYWVGKKHSAEHRDKVATAKTGLTLSDQTKDKIRQKALGRKIDEATKQKIGAAQKGKKVNQSTKDKMSEAAKLVWAARRNRKEKEA
jgi:hypothetical protein